MRHERGVSRPTELTDALTSSPRRVPGRGLGLWMLHDRVDTHCDEQHREVRDRVAK